MQFGNKYKKDDINIRTDIGKKEKRKVKEKLIKRELELHPSSLEGKE